MTLTEPTPTAPARGVVVLHGDVDVAEASRLRAELAGRIAVGTQVLVVDIGQVDLIDSAALGVLAEAARRLHDERSGSLVLRNASARLLRQLRLMRLDHVFELEI
jgi:anti-anti-sigma factor